MKICNFNQDAGNLIYGSGILCEYQRGKKSKVGKSIRIENVLSLMKMEIKFRLKSFENIEVSIVGFVIKFSE